MPTGPAPTGRLNCMFSSAADMASAWLMASEGCQCGAGAHCSATGWQARALLRLRAKIKLAQIAIVLSGVKAGAGARTSLIERELMRCPGPGGSIMRSMHKVNQLAAASGTSAQQARRRKVHAWLRVMASLSEQVVAELRTAAEQPSIDVLRAMTLAERLAATSRFMHDTFGTVFDSLEKSEDDQDSEEDTVMGDQDSILAKDMASVRLDVTGLKVDVVEVKADLSVMKEDISELKSDVAGLKVDVAELKSDVAELKADVAELKADVAELKSDVSELKSDVAELKVDVSELKADVVGLKVDVTELKFDVRHLKIDVNSLQLDVAVIRSNYASKSDVAEAKSAVILSCVGTMIALSGVAFAVAKLVH
jgi:septal ring factor EnvC (AmiA/AmiB activator)